LIKRFYLFKHTPRWHNGHAAGATCKGLGRLANNSFEGDPVRQESAKGFVLIGASLSLNGRFETSLPIPLLTDLRVSRIARGIGGQHLINYLLSNWPAFHVWVQRTDIRLDGFRRLKSDFFQEGEENVDATERGICWRCGNYWLDSLEQIGGQIEMITKPSTGFGNASFSCALKAL
jgi:hypothetical protein